MSGRRTMVCVAAGLLVVVVCLSLGTSHGAKLPNEDEPAAGEARVHDHKLSEQPHYTDLDKDNKFEHNKDYDHDAFLGKEEADKFKQLTPEESKERLGKIVDKIDKNRDGFVNENELRNWIRSQQKFYLQKSVEKRWKELKSDDDEFLTFDELIENTIGQPDTWTDEEKELKKDTYKTYLKLMERDKKRFKAADKDGDGKLSKKEYGDFLHPEESASMRDIVIDETLEDMDKNGDGVVSVDEYIEDIYPDAKKYDQPPEWVKTETENFKDHRDKNQDKVMDREEVAAWILPTDFDHTLSEAKHLIFEVDENKDGKLTKEEILEKYSVFVASQATGYGQSIYEHEDL